MITSSNSNQITAYYNPDHLGANKIKAYLTSTNKKILLIDIIQSKPSKSQWAEWSHRLSTSVKDFIDFGRIKDKNADTHYSEHDLIDIIQKVPQSLKGCILVNGVKIAHIQNAQEVLTFFNVDSRGLKKKPLGEPPTTSSQTVNESFT